MAKTICFCILMLYLGSSFSVETDPIQVQLKFLVTVDGKSFFADREIERNWTEASIYCNSMGMQLASITTQSQADALGLLIDSDDFNGSYWTSGRDAHLSRQFTWNGTDTEISSEYIAFSLTQVPIDYQTCVLYYIISTRSNLLKQLCSEPRGTLCETV